MIETNKKELSLEQQESYWEHYKPVLRKTCTAIKDLEWGKVQAKLEANPEKLWSLNEMERTGGEPDVVSYDQVKDEYIFMIA